MDGELPDAEVEAVLKDLQTPEGRAAWGAYHRVADVARTPDMDMPISAGFSARMAARLEAEPTVLAPAAIPETRKQSGQVKRFARPAFAVAAVAALAFVVTPPLMKGFKGHDAAENAQAMVASSSPNVSHASVIAAVAPPTVSGAVLSGMDDYVQAHQRVSPSFRPEAGLGAPVTGDSSNGVR